MIGFFIRRVVIMEDLVSRKILHYQGVRRESVCTARKRSTHGKGQILCEFSQLVDIVDVCIGSPPALEIWPVLVILLLPF